MNANTTVMLVLTMVVLMPLLAVGAPALAATKQPPRRKYRMFDEKNYHGYFRTW